jgi:uncharacterized repeat protein (TIGR01451 family)
MFPSAGVVPARRWVAGVAAFIVFGAAVFSPSARAQAVGRKTLQGHVPAPVSHLTPVGKLAATNQLYLAIGLPLRNRPALDEFLGQLYDPASTNYHKYLTVPEFTARFGPTEQDYQAVKDFAAANHLTVAGEHANRVVLDVTGKAADVERVFQIALRTYHHPTDTRDFFAPDAEPSVPVNLPVVDVQGLSDFGRPHPMIVPHSMGPQSQTAMPNAGSGPGGTFIGSDFRTAYVPGTTLNGANQIIGLVQFDGFYSNDITAYETLAGLPAVSIQTNLLDGYNGIPTTGSNSGNPEVSLDIEMVISMAPGMSKLIVYEGNPNLFIPNDCLSRIASDNLAKSVSSSWTWTGGPNVTTDSLLSQMASQGQSYYQASGDSDAYTGSNILDDPSNFTTPVASPYVTAVGGTTLVTTNGGAYFSESVWNWNNKQPNPQPNVGSSGGISISNTIPNWQNLASTNGNFRSTTMRNVPDVALTGDNVYVKYGNGSSGSFGGTSCAAPLWAGFTALINQQAAFAAKPTVGLINAAIYAMGTNANYTIMFHDITIGTNIGNNTPGLYFATNGYDLCTGLGTPNGTNFINALVPVAFAPAISASSWALLAESATPTNGLIDPGETVTVSFTLQNTGNLATSNLVATLQPSANVLAPSSPQTYGKINAFGGTTNKSFTFTAAGVCGSNFVATLLMQDGTNNLGSANFILSLGTSVVLPQNFDSVTAPALPSGWSSSNITGTGNNWITATDLSDTSPNSAFNSDSASPGENALVSPAISVIATNAQISFRHNYSFETGTSHHVTTYYDGGVLEIQIGNGSFSDILAAGGSFVTGGYNNSITSSSDNPLGGRSAWVSSSSGWKTVTVKLPASAAGQSIRLRWNSATDTGNSGGSAVGWHVDTISITDAPPNCLLVATDIGVSQSLATNSLQAGQNLVYTLTVTNLGLQLAANVVATDTVPVNALFISAPGGNYSAGKVVFSIGQLAANAATNFTLTLAPVSGTVFTNSLNAVTVTPEITLANNSTTLIATQSNPTAAGIVVPPVPQTIQCGSNVSFSVTVTGTPPLNLQWTLDGAAIAAATNSNLSLTNVHLPGHTVAVIVTNLYGSATSSVPLTVQDTLAPVITLIGSNPMFVELGSPFVNPGATATDVCAGAVAAISSGTVTTNIVSTNTVTYMATDGNGNTNTTTRTVIVHDTTPPVISWSFTNLVLAAGGNCSGTMTNVTGTNFIHATDLSGALTISQIPTNYAVLPLGTNLVVISVADASGNTSYSTNRIVVQDQTPPLISLQPQNQTNVVGTTASFNVGANACTPLTFQWYSNNVAMLGRTNTTLTMSNVTPALAGNYFAVATAAGGATTSSVVTLTVKLISPSFTLTSSGNPSGFKNAAQFTAQLTPTNAAGTVQFLTNGALFDTKSLVAGSATSTNISTLPRGTNTIAAIYSGDANDYPATNTLSQIVTNHPPTATAAFYSRLAGWPLDIPVANLATNWNDVDGDVVSLATIGVSTNGVTVTNSAGTLIYFGTNNVNDQFTCIISDGAGGTNSQVVHVVIVLTNTVPNIAVVPGGTNGNLTLRLGGAPGDVYVLETTTNLVSSLSWQPIATNTLGTNGVWQFTDGQATNFNHRFYRLKLVP